MHFDRSEFCKKEPTPDRNIHSLSQDHILLIMKINGLALYFQDKGKGDSLFGLDFKFNECPLSSENI
jgi:hypothetical protein